MNSSTESKGLRTPANCISGGISLVKNVLFGLVFIAVFIDRDLNALNAEQPAARSASSTETIVFFRHAEKPEKEFGQLSCQGLNRALALPQVLISKFGMPDYLFAPAPNRRTTVTGDEYNYVRPLATIEPTAIRLGLPVNTDYSFSDIDGLRFELTRDKYENARIYVSWEHNELERVVKQIVGQFNGDPGTVPKWEGKDYDSIYIVQIASSGSAKSVSFSQDHEKLDNLSTDCPDAKQP
jgi:hypothetical protein